jgi:hypothetical protein
MPFPTLFKNLSVSPDSDDFFIETLEFHHTAFSSPERIVNQPKDYTLTLEASAPVNPNTAVVFTNCPFDIKKPKKGDRGHQTLDIVIPNIDRRLTGQMDRARGVGGEIVCYWRTYAFSQQNSPILNPPPRFELKIGQINVFEVQLQATFFDFLNQQFPGKRYTSSFAPGLTR